MRYDLHSRLPDFNLDPPEDDEREFDELDPEEKVERLLEEFTAKELAQMYLEVIVEKEDLLQALNKVPKAKRK